MKTKKLLAALLACITALLPLSACAESSMPASSESAVQNSAAQKSPAADLTTMEMVKDMGLGINLGNTFEAVGGTPAGGVQSYETSWGSPVITKEMIEGYKNEGFGVLRVPVAWSNMMDKTDYTIDPTYLARVHEVVDWALDAGLYVIMNIHWDNGWWENFAVPEKKDNCMTRYTRIWEQLCAEFGSENESLMFESLNEEGCWDSLWNRYGTDETGKAEAYGLLNEINQKFVDLVRSSGEINAQRHLLIAGYATDVDCTCDAMFRMPDDPQNRCAVSVHYYTPPTFCILEHDADWGKVRNSWGSPRDTRELTINFDKLTERFVSQGIPVIIGEYGCPTKNKDAASIQRFLSSVCAEAVTRDMCPVLWSTTGNFYDRINCKMYDPALHDAMFAALNQNDAAA